MITRNTCPIAAFIAILGGSLLAVQIAFAQTAPVQGPVQGPMPMPAAEPAPPRQPADPPEVVALRKAIEEKNPNFKGTVNAFSQKENILAVEIHGQGITDLSPLKGLLLRGIDFSKSDIKDISVLKGMPLTQVYLEESKVSDISPLAGSPVAELFLSKTEVTDLSPLKDAKKLKQLVLPDTKVTDLKPLAGTSIEMLWLNNCPVEDISALKDVPLVSLTLENSKVADLSPLKAHKTLQRLHIGGTKVTDLRPIGWNRLKRLIFTPDNITLGIDSIRNMSSIEELDIVFPTGGRPVLKPAIFWQLYDKGIFKEKPQNKAQKSE